MKKSIITFITVIAMFYLAGSFVAASFNIKIWEPFLRGVIATISIFIGSIIISNCHDENIKS